jgi:hypothetical protein
MSTTTRRALLGIAVALAVALAPAAADASSTPASSPPNAAARKLLDSHELWATIDVCDAPKQLDTVGIRGSMPGDGKAHDKMYMSFRLQYLDATANTWIDVTSGATPAFVAVGGSASARQGGTSFQLVPVAGRPAVTFRGVVDFQWRRGAKVLLSAARTTTAGHRAVAGAEPAGYNAASCPIG